MSDRKYKGKFDRLRAKERFEAIEVLKIVNLVLKDKQYSSMIDIGTGGGLFAEAFKDKGINAVGIDCNDDFLSAVRDILPNITFKKAVAEEIPFANESFDFALMGHVYHEVDNREKAMSEAYRVVKERLVIVEWPYVSEEKGPPLDHRIKKEEIVEGALKAGFSNCVVKPLNNVELYIIDK